MCNEFSFENLFSGIYGAFKKTHPDICGSHLVTGTGRRKEGVSDKRKDQASWRHHIDVILGDVSIHVALCHMAKRTTGLAIRVHCCALYWKFMKSLFVTLFVVILPFFAVTIPRMFRFKCHPPQPKVQTCLKHHQRVHRENMELIRIPKRKHHLDIEYHCTIFYRSTARW